MRDLEKRERSLIGQLLVADPSLDDFHFGQSVILLTAHDEKEGALGVIINKPINQVLGEIRPELSDSSLASIPVYRGGPVRPEQVLLAGWLWDLEQQSFRLFFGLTTERTQELCLEYPDLTCFAFLGYAGWGERQLENELARDDWLVVNYGYELMNTPLTGLWQMIISRFNSNENQFSDRPDDPSLN